MADPTTRAELLGTGAQSEKDEGGRKGREASARCHTQYGSKPGGGIIIKRKIQVKMAEKISLTARSPCNKHTCKDIEKHAQFFLDS